MPKRSDAAEYVAPAIEVLPKPTCNMSSRPSLSTSCASLPGWTVRRWPRLVVPTSQPYNSRPDEFATSVKIASLLKRWMLGTHQGSVTATHLDAYLDEFAFRFNRRKSRRRGMLFYRLLENAVATQPTRYRPSRANQTTSKHNL